MNKRLAQKVAEKELANRTDEKIPDVLQECLPYQLAFIKDPSKRKAVCGTRRSAKSFALALYLLDAALRTPKGNFVYMALTNDSCKRVMWTDIFETVILKYNISAHLNSKNEIELPNGARIYLRGLDATPNQMNRLRGQAFQLAVLDECQDFTQDLRQIINAVLKMALAQSNATLCMAGTPGNQRGEHYWWQINRSESPETEWSRFSFSWEDNTAVDPKSGNRICDSIRAEIERDKQRRPGIDKTDEFRQEILGEWVIQTSARVYKSSDANIISQPPPDFFKSAIYILSLDLGYVDATAFVLAAYNSKYSDTLYILESQKQPGLIIYSVANEIKKYQSRYKLRTIYVDAANLQAVEEMRQHYGLPLSAAEKQGKNAHIAAINSDFVTENVRIVEHSNRELLQELNTLTWDLKSLRKGQHKEDGRRDNHLTDALLYAHHGSRHYWYHPSEQASAEDALMRHIEEKYIKPKTTYTIKRPWWQETDIWNLR